MERTIDRRQALKLLGGVAISAGLAGCTSEEGDQSTNPTTTSRPSPAQTMTHTQTATTTETPSPTATPSPTETPTATATKTPTPSPTATATKTPSPTPTPTPTPTKKGKTVSFKSRDGRTITGTFYGSGSCAVVFAPGVGYSRDDWAPQALTVAEAGHAALTVDLNFDNRAHNVDTLVGAASYLREKHNIETIVLVGASAGANAVVKANTVARTNVAGSVIIAPGRARAYAPDLSGRLLFVVGKNDDRRFVLNTKQMYQQASEPKRLVTLPTDKHAQEIFATNLGGELTNLIVEFVNTVCSNSG